MSAAEAQSVAAANTDTTPVVHPPGIVAPGGAHVNVLRLPSCWIEIELLDEEEHGVAQEPYRVRLPDGAIREGHLDEKGSVRLNKIPCGECVVQFPNIDNQEWTLAACPSASGQEAWIEIALQDEAGKPLAREPYHIQTPEGKTLEGVLDASGFARIAGLQPGVCTVTFPRLDAGEYIA